MIEDITTTSSFVPTSFVVGDTDLSGFWDVVQSISKGECKYDEDYSYSPFEIDDEDCLHIFWDYLISRVQSPSSRSGQALLAANDKFAIYKAIIKLIDSGKWKKHMSARLAFTEPFDEISDY